MWFQVALAVGAAGALGAVARFLLTELVRHACSSFPLSTLVVNAFGCLVFGFCWQVGHSAWRPWVQAAAMVGFLGSFTTFSTFAFDCQQLIEEARWLAVSAYVLAQNACGLAAVFLGVALAGWVRPAG